MHLYKQGELDMTMAEFEEMKRVAELNTLWYTPWWERVDWQLVNSIVLIAIVVLFAVLFLSSDKNYLKVWRGIGRVLVGMIVVAETIHEVVKPFPKKLKENLVRDRVIR